MLVGAGEFLQGMAALDRDLLAAIGRARPRVAILPTASAPDGETVFRRWAQIHPLITVIGAFAGIRYLGLLGILIGPLALSYFFELVRLYNEEYVNLSGDIPDRPPPVT